MGDLDMSELIRITDNLSAMNTKTIEYGFPVDEAHSESDLNIPTIAMYNNEGVKAKAGGEWKIPPRPFMEIAAILVDSDMDRLAKQVSLAGEHSIGAVDKSLDYIAKEAADRVRDSIETQNFVSLAASTIEAKGSDTILIDSGEMYDAAKGIVTSSTGES